MKSLNQMSLGMLFMHGYMSSALLRQLREEVEVGELECKLTNAKATKPSQVCCSPVVATCS